MPTLRAPLKCLVSLALVVTAGCDDASEDDEVTIDLDALLVEIDGYQDTLEVANAPVLGSHGAMMTVWIQSESVDDYVGIDPENRTELLFPVGTLIVKEHLDNLEPFELAIMYKGPVGYNPDHGDWWYGKIDLASGELTVSGKDPVECVDCHSSASVSDYVHGLPPA